MNKENERLNELRLKFDLPQIKYFDLVFRFLYQRENCRFFQQMRNVKYAVRLTDENRVITNVQPNELQ